jgi:hypothetical protein
MGKRKEDEVGRLQIQKLAKERKAQKLAAKSRENVVAEKAADITYPVPAHKSTKTLSPNNCKSDFLIIFRIIEIKKSMKCSPRFGITFLDNFLDDFWWIFEGR